MPHKLSEAQRRVLEAMRDGATLSLTRFGDGHIWLTWYPPFAKYRTQTVRKNTWAKLYRLDLLEFEDDVTSPVTNFELTPTGRAALQQSGVGEEKNGHIKAD